MGTCRKIAACVLASALIGCGADSRHWVEQETFCGPFQTLSNMRDADLQELLADESFDASALAECARGDFRVWQFMEGKDFTPDAVYVALQAYRAPHPGSTRVRITVISGDGKVLSTTRFTTGHRAYLWDAHVERPDAAKSPVFWEAYCDRADRGDEGEFPVLVLDTSDRSGPGPDYAKQYYVLIDGGGHLVRVEGPAGRATRNDYDFPKRRCGPLPPWRTRTEFESDLMSGDRWKLLRALLWLGGKHDEGPLQEQADDSGDRRLTEIYRDVAKREDIIERVRSLSEHKDEWIREAAQLALEPPDDRY
ncbi:MAG: hypothetical protein ACYTKD_12850 [Planctomycetota bacterium]|jgi:hypothetical protein